MIFKNFLPIGFICENFLICLIIVQKNAALLKCLILLVSF